MILTWCLLGAIAGIIAGLIPGLHSNNIAILLLASPIFGTEITAFMLSMCIVQSFVDFIPATFLGAPSENTFESILPAHRLLLKGKAIEGICYTVFGGLIAVIAGAILTPVFFLYIEQNSKQIIQATPIALIAAIIIFITTEKTIQKKLTAIFVIIASASQGILFQDQIFPLITGYFGIAGTLYSIKEKPIHVKQKETAKIKTKTILEALIGLAGGALVAVIPGIGTNTAAGIINAFRKTVGTKKYLAMLGAINASNFFFSYATLLALQKARNGTMIALQDKIFYTQGTLLTGTAIMILSAGIGGLAAIILAKKTAKIFTEKKTMYFSSASIIIMILLTAIFNGIIGIIALFFATALGLFVLINGIKRSTCMCALIVPALIFYLFALI